jgi:hypothetical protein
LVSDGLDTPSATRPPDYDSKEFMNNYDNALSYSSQWLDIIKQENFPEEQQAKWIIDESKQKLREHFNRGWLEYRKSVTGRPAIGHR